jgi:hypothetical protein
LFTGGKGQDEIRVPVRRWAIGRGRPQMDWLRIFLDWAGDTSNSNAIRTIVALLAIPGALWGGYLFYRWRIGKSLVDELDAANAKLDAMVTVTSANNQTVSFKRTDVEKMMDVARRRKYQTAHGNFMLADVLVSAYGFLNNYEKKPYCMNVRPFVRSMAQHFQVSPDALPDSDVEGTYSKDQEVIASRLRLEVIDNVIDKVVGDSLALELIYSELVKGRNGEEDVRYFLTNLGRAVARELSIASDGRPTDASA